MKVYNLQCAAGHGFEGWFGSEADYQSQQERGLLSCPLCGEAKVTRMPSAPRLNLSGATAPVAPASRASTAGSAPQHRPTQQVAATTLTATPPGQGRVDPAEAVAALEALWVQTVKHVLANTEDVGTRFSEEARRMHYGETEARGIRGQASPEETQELREEGIEVLHLPLPEMLKGPVQ